MNELQYIPQAFDSKLFGIPVYTLEPKSALEIRKLAKSIPTDAGLVSVRVPKQWSNEMCQTDFRKIEHLVTFKRQLEASDHYEASTAIRMSTTLDAQGCRALAAKCFKHDRYHKDPFIDNEIADTNKAQWAFNNIMGRGDSGFILEIQNQIVGFNLCRRIKDTAIIDLIAIEPQIQGQGYGQALLKAALNYYTGKAKTIQAGTQVDNSPSLEIYKKNGFHLVAEHLTYHWTSNQNESCR